MNLEARSSNRGQIAGLRKCPTGIPGLDEVTQGGIPLGRSTLVCGGPGCGKTLLGLEFLTRGIRDYNEPGLFLSFEEGCEEILENLSALASNVPRWVRDRKLKLLHIPIDRNLIQETGPYTLDGLFIRLGSAIQSIGAKRVVIDTLEALFSGFTDVGQLRNELRRMMRWLKQQGITSIITAERGEAALTRTGIEAYVADCVIMLEQRVDQQIGTRRLRIVKYRGSSHGLNEYPFLISEEGVSVVPTASASPNKEVPRERVSTGVNGLDQLLGGRGFYRGNTLMISGGVGTGKTSLALSMIQAACARGEKAHYITLEESGSQLIRNMQSIGVMLKPFVDQRLLQFHAARPSLEGFDYLLSDIQRITEGDPPQWMVFDPISTLPLSRSSGATRIFLTQLVELLKHHHVNVLFLSLEDGDRQPPETIWTVASLMDVWIRLTETEWTSGRERKISVLKARGLPHLVTPETVQMTKRGLLVEPANPISRVFSPPPDPSRKTKIDPAPAGWMEKYHWKQWSHRRREIDLRRQSLQAELSLIEEERLWGEKMLRHKPVPTRTDRQSPGSKGKVQTTEEFQINWKGVAPYEKERV